jgi:hypothetical protein
MKLDGKDPVVLGRHKLGESTLCKCPGVSSEYQTKK